MLTIGNIKLQSRVILAPMCAVTDMPFRWAVKRFAPKCLTISEMIASDAAVHEKKDLIQKARLNPEEEVAAIQIAGYNPEIVARAAEIAINQGAKIIDLNFGCPVKKIVNNFSGSALLRDLERFASIIKATKETCEKFDVPLTIKTRTGWSPDCRNAPEAARIAEDLGVSMITIHGRTRSQLFSGEADWEFVGVVKNNVRIPVIVNGDIKTPQDAKKALEVSGCDGVMIGRGAYGKPWLLAQIHEFLENNQILESPLMSEIVDTIVTHSRKIMEFYGVVQSIGFLRKHLAWYSKSLPEAAAFRTEINGLQDPLMIIEKAAEYFMPTHANCLRFETIDL